MNLSATRLLFLLALGASLPVSQAGAQVLAPGYTGFQRIPLPGNSDSYISVPFARPEAATAVVQSVSGNTITVKGITPWTPNRFVNQGGANDDTYYLLVVSGAGEGSTFPITASGASSLTVDLDGETLNVAANDLLAVIPYWTLGTLFPAGAGVHVSPSASDIRTEIIFPDLNAPSLTGGVSRLFYCLNGNWTEEGQPANVRNNQIILPDSLIIVRHNIPTATTLLANGMVVTSKLRTVLGVNPASKRDNFLGLQRPTTFTLGSSGLVSSGAFAVSPSLLSHTDELYVYDNTVAKKNKSASATYFYWSGGWRKVGSGSTLFDTSPLLTPGSAFIIRKATGSTAPSWINIPNY